MVTINVVLDVRRVRVTLVTIGALYPAETAEISDVVVKILAAFEHFLALIAGQSGDVHERVARFRALRYLPSHAAHLFQVQTQVFLFQEYPVAEGTFQ